MQIIINRHKILANRTSRRKQAPIALKRGGKTIRHVNSYLLPEGSRLIYSPDRPLSCGATVWIDVPESNNERTKRLRT